MGEQILVILGEFGGGRGEAEDIAVRFLLPAVFWAILATIAAQRWRDNGERRNLIVLGAATVGLGRELFMFASQWPGWHTLLPQTYLHHIYPPLEHAMTLITGVLLGYAHLAYGERARRRARLFLSVGLATAAGLYIATAIGWPGQLARHPGMRFGAYWGDMGFRVAASVLLGWVVAWLLASRRRGETVPWTLLLAFTFLFLDEFLMIFNLAQGEVYRTTYAPIRHNLHIWAVLLLILAFGARQHLELRRSERRLRHAQEVARLGSWVLHPRDGEIECSGEMLRLCGIPASGDWQRVPMASLARRLDRRQRRLLLECRRRAGAEPGRRVQAELRLPCGTEERILLVELSAHRHARHGVPRLVGTVQDVTEARQAEEALWRTRLEIIERLARAAEYRSAETGRHLARMSGYAEVLARAAGLDARHCELIRRAAPMHDIGKIAIPDRILLKPGPLSAEEHRVMERHAQIGADMLAGDDSEPMRTARLIALTHHERWDGSGYPRGLAGTDIPIEGRVCAVADVFDALTTERTYKPAWDIERATRHILDRAGSHFDPELVAAFRSARAELEQIRARHPEPIREDRRVGLAISPGASG